MNDTTRSLPPTKGASCQSCQSCQPALPGTTEPYLLELELQVARSYSSYCLLHAYLLALKSMVRTLPFLVGSQETQAARAAQQSPSDPTRGDGKERRDASQEGKRGPANAHATARHVFFAHLGTSIQPTRQQNSSSRSSSRGKGAGRADGLTGRETPSAAAAAAALPSLATANFCFVDPGSPGKVFARPTLAHDDGRGHGRDRGNGMGEPVGIGETQRDIVAVKLFRRWRTPRCSAATTLRLWNLGEDPSRI